MAAGLGSLSDSFAPADRSAVEAVARALSEMVVEEREERVVVAGTSHLARAGGDFP